MVYVLTLCQLQAGVYLLISLIFLKFWSKPTFHGVHYNNLFDEYKFFSKKNCTEFYKETNFALIEIYNISLFYTGTAILGKSLNINFRQFLSYMFGESCNVLI